VTAGFGGYLTVRLTQHGYFQDTGPASEADDRRSRCFARRLEGSVEIRFCLSGSGTADAREVDATARIVRDNSRSPSRGGNKHRRRCRQGEHNANVRSYRSGEGSEEFEDGTAKALAATGIIAEQGNDVHRFARTAEWFQGKLRPISRAASVGRRELEGRPAWEIAGLPLLLGTKLDIQAGDYGERDWGGFPK